MGGRSTKDDTSVAGSASNCVMSKPNHHERRKISLPIILELCIDEQVFLHKGNKE